MKILKFFASNWLAWMIILIAWLITPYLQDVEIVNAIGDMLKRLNLAQAMALSLILLCLGTLAMHIFTKPETTK